MKERTLQWDGKCDQCRKLMSQCMCFQERADRLAGQQRGRAPELEIKADQRPLYNALRKMHHKTPASFLVAPPPAGDARRDRTKSHDLPPRHHPSRQRDPRLRLLSTSATGVSASAAPLKPTASMPSMAAPPTKLQAPRVQSGVPVAGLHVTRRPSSAHNQSSSSRSSRPSSNQSDPAAAKRASIYAGASGNPARPSAAYPYSSFDASSSSSLAPAGESFDSTDAVWEL